MACKKQKGFTVVELMIAISVFSVVILIATIAVIQIGRNYQQANTKTQLLDASREIHAQIGQAYQFSGSNYLLTKTTDNIYDVLCIGNTKFLWILNEKDQLWQEDLGGAVSCTSPKSVSAKNPLPTGSVVTKFDVGGSDGMSLDTRFVVGSLDMFVSGYGSSCKSAVIGAEFCAVVPLSSTVVRKQ